MTAGQGERARVPGWALAAWSDIAINRAAGIAPGDPVRDPAGARARWGFDHETWLLSAGDRRLVVQRRSDRTDPTRPRACRVRAAVRSAGLPVPEPTRAGHDGGHAVVTLPFVEGRPGSELLSDRIGAAAIGRLCGAIDSVLARVDPAGLGLLGTWASGDRLRGAGSRWLRQCERDLDARSSRLLAGLLEVAARDTDAATPRFAHGDLAPVNVLVRDGEVAAVLDLDRARLAHPLFDAAWFGWVVGHHHPEVASAAWRGFAAAVGVPADRPAAFAWLQPLQLLERAAGATRPAERTRWAERLGAALEGDGHG